MPYIGYDPSAPGTISVQRYTAGVDFTAGTTSSLTIASNPGTANNITIYFDGLAQHHDQWSWDNTTITFTSAIPLGTSVVEIVYGVSVAINVPASGSVTLTKLADSLLGTLAPPGQGVLLNGKIATSVASNALTIAVKGADGNDPSASNPVFVAFRDATASNGGFNVRKITAALSVVVSSGSTLGHASNVACHLFAYLIDNSGTVELAVSNLPPDYPGVFANTRLISTTAEGGAGAADSATGIYSTTARSNVPWVCVAMCKSTQTTAGTWAAAMTQVDQAPFQIPTCAFYVYRASTQSISSGVNTLVQNDNELFDLDGIYNTSTYEARPFVAGLYEVLSVGGFQGPGDGVQVLNIIGKSSAVYAASQGSCGANSRTETPGCSALVLLNGTSDTLQQYLYQSSGSSQNNQSGVNYGYLSARRVSGGQ